jgi:hypothetical protein
MTALTTFAFISQMIDEPNDFVILKCVSPSCVLCADQINNAAIAHFLPKRP